MLTGRDPHEERRRAKQNQQNMVVRIDDEPSASNANASKSMLDRFRDNFGPFGLLHFLTPVVPLFLVGGGEDIRSSLEQRVGYRRVITFNHDYVRDGMVHTSEHNLTLLQQQYS